MFTKSLNCLCCLLIYICSGYAQQLPAYHITHLDSSSSGYYFINPLPNTSQNVNGCQMIMDNKGRMVYFRDFGNISTTDFKLLSNGLMSYSNKNQFSLMDSSCKIIDSIMSRKGYAIDLHDIQLLTNGHYLILASETDTMDLSNYLYFSKNGSPGSKKAQVKAGIILELDASKKVVFEWHCKDHFNFDDVDPYFMGSPVNIDWTHLNAIAPDNDGNILLSVRYFNEITKINRKDGSIIWRLGGKNNQFSFVNDSQGFVAQHDIRRIANGHITLFDNGRNATSFHAQTAREYALDENTKTATLVWSYIEDTTAYSLALGNVQRLANGNTLINYGNYSKGNVLCNVIKPNGAKAFEISFDDSLSAYRSYCFDKIPIQRPQITCFKNNGQYYLDAGEAYSEYHWSNGDTSQTIALSEVDTFTVHVPSGYGGYVYSEPFIVQDINAPCGTSAVFNQKEVHQFSISPNPASTELVIDNTGNSAAFTSRQIQIYNVDGRAMMLAPATYLDKERFILNISSLHPGLYSLQINGVANTFVKY